MPTSCAPLDDVMGPPARRPLRRALTSDCAECFDTRSRLADTDGEENVYSGLHGLDGQPYDYPAPVCVRNTFVALPVGRDVSLEEFFEERHTQSCPASWGPCLDDDLKNGGFARDIAASSCEARQAPEFEAVSSPRYESESGPSSVAAMPVPLSCHFRNTLQEYNHGTIGQLASSGDSRDDFERNNNFNPSPTDIAPQPPYVTAEYAASQREYAGRDVNSQRPAVGNGCNYMPIMGDASFGAECGASHPNSYGYGNRYDGVVVLDANNTYGYDNRYDSVHSQGGQASVPTYASTVGFTPQAVVGQNFQTDGGICHIEVAQTPSLAEQQFDERVVLHLSDALQQVTPPPAVRDASARKVTPPPPPLIHHEGAEDSFEADITPPSKGSVNHRLGRCKPCAFVHTRGCENGSECPFCHLCDPGEKKRRRKDKQETRRAVRSIREAFSFGNPGYTGRGCAS